MLHAGMGTGHASIALAAGRIDRDSLMDCHAFIEAIEQTCRGLRHGNNTSPGLSHPSGGAEMCLCCDH